MATYLILAAVVLICAYAVYSYIRKLRVGGGCCGEREAAPKRVKVRTATSGTIPMCWR